MLRNFSTRLIPFFKQDARKTHTKSEIKKLVLDSKKIISEYKTQTGQELLWKDIENRVEQIGNILKKDQAPSITEKLSNMFSPVITRYYSTPEEAEKLRPLLALENHFLNKGIELTKEDLEVFKEFKLT